jgi:hypothetical protein
VRGFFDRQSTEGAQLNDPREPAIDSFQARQRLIQPKYRYFYARGAVNDVLERHALQVVASFPRPLTAGVVDKNPPHHLSGDAKKVRAILPVAIALFDEAQVRLVHERGGLQSVTIPLTVKLTRSDATQFAVNQRQQAIERISIASAPMVEQCGDVPICWHPESCKP